MNFVLENISKNSGRLGQLVHIETDRSFKTPLLLQITKSGSIPYLSREVFNYISKNVQILQMSLATIDQMAESLALYGDSLSAYVGYKEYPTLLLIRDACEETPNGFNDKDVVPLFTRRGRQQYTTKRYMSAIETFVPDIYVGLCDADTNFDSSKKRMQKSVDRTENFMSDCYEMHKKSEKLNKSALFAPIVGGYSTYARSESIKHAKYVGGELVSGYVLEGFHNNGLTATTLNSVKLLDIMSHCLKEMEVDKPKVMPGAYTPVALLELIRLGVDIFDTSYAYCAATNFKVLTFNFDLDSKLTCETPFLDVTDESLKEDFRPFMDNCVCIACKKHTRAYVHHLYKTKELLGHILIMLHNLQHYMSFFDAIHRCIANDNLHDLLQLVRYQQQDVEVDYSIVKNTKLISKASFMTN